MPSLKARMLLVCMLALVPLAVAGNNLGIHDSGKIVFNTPTRVGDTLLPAGDYVVRHTTGGQEHLMVFQSVNHKVREVKAKSQLVQLGKNADHTTTYSSLTPKPSGSCKSWFSRAIPPRTCSDSHPPASLRLIPGRRTGGFLIHSPPKFIEVAKLKTCVGASCAVASAP